jgi:tetratricopeptide (TPR) repeat protein
MGALSQQSYEHGLALSGQGRHLEAIGAFEAALAAKPDDAKILFALGHTAEALGLPAPAEAFYRKVLAQEPGRLEALVNLANLLRAQGRFAAAAELIAPHCGRQQSPELHLTLGSVWREEGNYEKAAGCYRAALNADADCIPALSNLADLLTDGGDKEEALALYDRALALAPDHAQLRLNRSILHLLAGDLAAGWRDYEARLGVAGKAPASDLSLPVWDGGTLAEKRLLVRAEQGVGDQLMFASCLPDLAARAADEGGRLVVECDPRLVSLLARSLPGCTIHAATWHSADGKVIADYGWLDAAGGADQQIFLGSLPLHMRRGLRQFSAPHAYLRPAPEERARWRTTFAEKGTGAFIGICWRSGKTGGHRALQYAPLAAWAKLLRDLPGTAVSVQYDATSAEIAELERLSGRTLLVPGKLDQKNELDRCCAMLSALDGVVSAPTAVSWLAAGAGVPTLKMLYDTSWTALGQSFEPFAPACTLVMPKMRGDWSDSFAQAAAQLPG